METLRVGAVFPHPPFTGMPDKTGLDIELVTALAERLGATVQFVPYDGADFDGIFAGLGAHYDCVAAGATVMPERETRAVFLPPYVISGQALAVDIRRLPDVRSVDALAGRTIGVRRGSSGRPIAERLVADGKAGAVNVYDFGSLPSALNDMKTGGVDAVLGLAPVLTELVKPVVGVEVVQRGISTEHIAIAVAPGDQALLGRLTVAQAELEDDGTLQRIRRKWLGNPYTDQSLAVH